MELDHNRFMAIAIEEAKAGGAQGEQPFGAVVVDGNGELVVRSRSLKVSACDATAHSETLAVKYATQKLGRRVGRESAVAACAWIPGTDELCISALLG